MSDISKITLPNNEEYNLKDTKARQDINLKANKVNNATNDNFAALDENGNLKDSGHKHSDYLTQHQSLAAYRTAAAQDVIDAGKETAGLGLTGASVGDLVRVKTVDASGKPTSWQKVPLCDIVTNPNLLDNWYFVYGKAINNDYSSNGTFPVNQRGQRTNSSGYHIDRWATAGHGTTQINENGILITATGTYSGLYQKTPMLNLFGEKVTFTALTSNGKFEKTITLPTSVPASNTPVFIEGNTSSIWFQCYAMSSGNFETGVYCANGNSTTVKAVKLELGSEQTLAHLENGIWVLNEIPDYQTELIRCKTSTADRTDIYANKTIGYNISNRNLLDNWDFTNPVNQRGQITWQNADEYTVDRWKLTSGTASLGAAGLTLNGTLVQIREKAIGQPVTCSALLSNGSMITPIYDDSTETFTITATGQTIKAAKLEIGSEQTLAHLENGIWVLNEIPDYGEELAKCQRYLMVLQANASYSEFAYGVVQDDTTAVFYVRIPEMANLPAATFSGNLRVVAFGSNGFIVSNEISSLNRGGSISGFYKLTAKGTFTNMPGLTVVLQTNNNANTKIELSAEQ